MTPRKLQLVVTIGFILAFTPGPALAVPSDEVRIDTGTLVIPVTKEEGQESQSFTFNFSSNDPNLTAGILFLTEKDDAKAASDKIELKKGTAENSWQLVFTFDVPPALPEAAKIIAETGDFQDLTKANVGSANWPFGSDFSFKASIKSDLDVPEPAALTLLMIGIVGLALTRRRGGGQPPVRRR